MSVLRSYQAEHGPDFPWSVGKDGPGVESRGGKDDPDWELRAFSPSAGEDMSAEGRRQLALFLVSSRGSRRGEGLQGEAYQSCCRILERVGGWFQGEAALHLPALPFSSGPEASTQL